MYIDIKKPALFQVAHTEIHRKPYFYLALSAKQPYTYWVLCGKRHISYSIICLFATPTRFTCVHVHVGVHMYIYTYGVFCYQ